MGYQSGSACPCNIARLRCLRAVGAWFDDEYPLEAVAAPTDSCGTCGLLACWRLFSAGDVGICSLAPRTWLGCDQGRVQPRLSTRSGLRRIFTDCRAIWASWHHDVALCIISSDQRLVL